MAGQAPRCAYILCSEPLPAGARSDKQYCCPAHKAAARRWRRHYAEAVGIGIAFIWGLDDEHVVRCPVCGRRFALGHGHRRDAIYCGHACRQTAYRDRQRVRLAVTDSPSVTDPRTTTSC
ncbi:hypothetical protein Srufu_080030 (plasmid) [Streptomyces libani subsp. rufus]|nr:hypothetical protein Srufu_080030 [Streptomyces libani subsp. rufus]